VNRLLEPRRVPGLVLLVVVAWASSSAPGTMGPDIPAAVYEQAARDGSTGEVTGRITLTGKPPSLDEPVAGAVLTLVPRSEPLLDALTRLRRALRDEPEKYASSAEAVVAVQREYVQALERAGQDALVRRTTSGSDGRFEFAGVPAGPWLLLGQRWVWVDKPGPGLSRRERQIFRDRPRLLGYHAVTFWVREVSVLPGRRVSVELTDRNAWMTGIAEKRAPGAHREGGPAPEAG
jgi:hypothetical protein